MKVGVVRTGSGTLKRISRASTSPRRRRLAEGLRTDYIDLYQMHNPTIEDLRQEEIQDAMERLQDAGKIRFWGVSVSTPEEGVEIMQRGWAHALQVLYNILNQAPALALLPTAKEKGYGIVARVPLASGLLTGKFRIDSVFPSDDIRQNFLTPRRLQEAIERVDEAKSIIGGASRSLAEGRSDSSWRATQFPPRFPALATRDRVETNAAAVEGSLSAEIVDKLRARLGEYNFYQRHGIRL